MVSVLTSDSVEHYKTQGWLSPVDIFTEEEATEARAKLEAFEAANGPMNEQTERSRAYLPFRWVDELMRDPRLVDVVESLIGPDILCWNAFFWIKEPGTGNFVGWHQDVTYWGLDNRDLVTVWVALSNADEQAGCMSVLPGSNALTLSHDDTYDSNNLLTRGQHINDIDPAKTVAMPLRPGQASFHNVATAHGSGPNDGGDRRIGLSLHYMPTHTRQTLSEWDSAAFIRGEDRYNHFDHAPRPTVDNDPEVMEYHKRASDTLREILYQGADASRPTI